MKRKNGRLGAVRGIVLRFLAVYESRKDLQKQTKIKNKPPKKHYTKTFLRKCNQRRQKHNQYIRKWQDTYDNSGVSVQINVLVYGLLVCSDQSAVHFHIFNPVPHLDLHHHLVRVPGARNDPTRFHGLFRDF